MLNLKQPLTLVTCASNCLIKSVQFWNSGKFDIQSLTSLQEYLLLIPNNLFDQWAEKLLLSLNRSQRKCDAHFLVFSPALTRLNIDDFPTFPVNVNMLCEYFKFSLNLKYLRCHYAPFFWSPIDILIFQNSIANLKNLQTLTLCNLDLMESPSFLEVVGKQIPNLKELDISYGKIPAQSYTTICENFLHIEILKIKQHSEEFRTITHKHVMQLLTSLLRLKILDDDTTIWSCILPAFTQLSKDMYSDLFASLYHLTIYQCSEVNVKFTKKVSSVCLDSRIFKDSSQKNMADVNSWLFNNFPALQSIDLRLENVQFSTIERFFQTKNVGWKIHSIFLSKIPLNFTNFKIIGKNAPNLKRFEVINQLTLNAMMDDQYIAPEDNGRLTEPFFGHLKHLSFTGAWEENIACLLLNHCFLLQELILKPTTISGTFLKHNPLRYLRRLIFDTSHLIWNSSDLEIDFLQRVLQSTNSLREIGLKLRPSKEWDCLLQQLKITNCDLQVLRSTI